MIKRLPALKPAGEFWNGNEGRKEWPMRLRS